MHLRQCIHINLSIFVIQYNIYKMQVLKFGGTSIANSDILQTG